MSYIEELRKGFKHFADLGYNSYCAKFTQLTYKSIMTDQDDWEFVPPAGDGSDVYGPLIMCMDAYQASIKQVMMSELVRMPHKYVHEAFKYRDQWLKPYADCDKAWETEVEMNRNKWSEYERCLAELQKIFGPKVKIYGSEACGYSAEKKKWKTSFHFTMVGAGAYKCGMDIIRAGLVPQAPGFDKAPYGEVGSRRSMRMLGTSKKGENRPLRFVQKRENGEWGSADIWAISDLETRKHIIKSMLIQASEGEERMEVVKVENTMIDLSKETRLIEDRKVAVGKNGLPFGEDIKLTSAAQVERLCRIAGWFEEVDRDVPTYCNEMWLLRNTADIYQLDVEEMRALAHRVAAVCPNNDLAHVERTFNQTADRNPDKRRKLMGALRDQAKLKDPIAYYAWAEPLQEEKQLEIAGGDKKKASIVKLANTELNDADVAEVLIEGGWLDDYIWDYNAGVIYVWNGVHWKPSNKDILITLIQVELYNALEAYARSKWTAENTNPLACIGAMKKLRNSRSTDGIIKSTCGLLMRKRPIDGIEWDNIPFKLAFDNGVLNLKTGIFEEGKKEDHLTMTTGWALPLEVNKRIDVLRGQEEKRLMKLGKLYEKIQPNADIRAILWQIMGSCLVGQILENVFILTGEGRNGKSVSTDLLKSVLGQFAYRGDDATIQRDNGSATNQAVANMKSKRLTLFAEPHEGQKLKTSILKDLTGSSETHARALYATNTSIKLTHKVFIECNGGVNYDKIDQAIEKRTIIVPFPSLFTTQQEIDTLPPDAQNIYLVNPKYKNAEWQKKHRVAVLLKMLDGLREMMAISNGQFILSKIPEAMRAVKHEFLENSDEFGSWFFETYQRSEENEAFVQMKDVHDLFLQSRTYSNFAKQERRTKGKKQYLSEKLLSNPKIKPFFRERYQPRIDGKQVEHRSVLLGFERINPFG